VNRCGCVISEEIEMNEIIIDTILMRNSEEVSFLYWKFLDFSAACFRKINRYHIFLKNCDKIS